MFSMNRVTYSPGSVILSVAIAMHTVWQAHADARAIGSYADFSARLRTPIGAAMV